MERVIFTALFILDQALDQDDYTQIWHRIGNILQLDGYTQHSTAQELTNNLSEESSDNSDEHHDHDVYYTKLDDDIRISLHFNQKYLDVPDQTYIFLSTSGSAQPTEYIKTVLNSLNIAYSIKLGFQEFCKPCRAITWAKKYNNNQHRTCCHISPNNNIKIWIDIGNITVKLMTPVDNVELIFNRVELAIAMDKDPTYIKAQIQQLIAQKQK